MKSLVAYNLNSESSLTLEQREVPVPKNDEVVVEIHAAALNPLDEDVKSGYIPFAKNPPIILGNEGAGIVKSKNSKFPIGTKVIIQGNDIGVKNDGTFQENICIPIKYLIPLPKEYSFEEGAALSVSYLTAYSALDYYCNLEKISNEWIIVTGASGSVGLAALQIISALNLKPIAVVSTKVREKQLNDLGYKHIINLDIEEINEGINRITENSGVQIALDTLGGDITDKLLNSLNKKGKLICIGYKKSVNANINILTLISNSIEIIGYDIYALSDAYKTNVLNKIYYLANQGLIRPIIGDSYLLEDWFGAFNSMKSRKILGKTIFKIN
ncbi:hypothetical protein CPU09_14100 [Mammaliicoccus sciuri]|uniref:quinone oxidoreductase family protein n=1 Tax=Mammaliicoccus sciuri TaxID=1296 RepID=UPI000BBE896E|nr:zinc-binding alcohol dehydrogenase family protein [Mammaliicoccus sciuri]PCM40009.1 hypothetical protein CPU09_14100 [Mammaliicoccus sciuri]